jgi:hypothetical protein
MDPRILAAPFSITRETDLQTLKNFEDAVGLDPDLMYQIGATIPIEIVTVRACVGAVEKAPYLSAQIPKEILQKDEFWIELFRTVMDDCLVRIANSFLEPDHLKIMAIQLRRTDLLNGIVSNQILDKKVRAIFLEISPIVDLF